MSPGAGVEPLVVSDASGVEWNVDFDSRVDAGSPRDAAREPRRQRTAGETANQLTLILIP